MNRRAAKLLTITGIFCCSVAPIPIIFGVGETPLYALTALILGSVGGIVLIVVSLAYYTEK